MPVRIGLFYKNFALWKNLSHIGLGVAAQANADYLNSHDENATVFAVRHNIDIVDAIKTYNSTHPYPLTHVVISAPWLSTRDLSALVSYFNTTQFVVVSHSNVGFLQADPSGIHLLRDYIELTHKFDNLSVGGNTFRFTNWLREAYDVFVVLLPNMYPVHPSPVHLLDKEMIKIGSFGAIRPLKNQLTAAAASVIICNNLEKPVEFHLSAGREEDGGNIVLEAIKQMVEDIPNFTLVLDGWRGWHEFRELVREMNLLIHPSYTESFNIASADGVSQNVPVVGSTAIEWLPKSWKGDSDNAVELANIGIRLLKEGAEEGIEALKHHNKEAFKSWKGFLKS